MIEADFHIHSKYSRDSFLSPSSIIKTAKKKGLSAVAVTDHETTRGAKETVKLNNALKDLIVIPGIEIKTELGDLIGLFVEEDIAIKEAFEVIDSIKDQDGLVVLTHPARNHKNLNSKIMFKIDLVEGFNGRSSRSENVQARILAYSINKPMIAGSDAHFSFEIGRIKTQLFGTIADSEDLRNLIKKGERKIIGKEAPFFVHTLSFGMEIIKKFWHS